MRDDWEMSSSVNTNLLLLYRYDSLLIKDFVMWRHYNVNFENSDITTRPWHRLAISDNLNFLSAYVIWNILMLNIKGKVNKMAITF